MTTTTTIDIPQPTTGPTAKLAFNDPATLIMILAWVGETAKALSDQLGQGHVSVGGVLTAIAATAVTLGVVVSKHVYSGKLAGAVPTVMTALTQVATAVDPQVVADLKAGLAELETQFHALLVDQTQAVKDALAGLLGVVPPAPPAAQVAAVQPVPAPAM